VLEAMLLCQGWRIVSRQRLSSLRQGHHARDRGTVLSLELSSLRQRHCASGDTVVPKASCRFQGAAIISRVRLLSLRRGRHVQDGGYHLELKAIVSETQALCLRMACCLLCLRQHYHLEAGAFVFGVRALCLGWNCCLNVEVVVFEMRALCSRQCFCLEPRVVVLETVPPSQGPGCCVWGENTIFEAALYLRWHYCLELEPFVLEAAALS
jgi:hypothetical protein